MFKSKYGITLMILFFTLPLFAQKIIINKIEPANWWVGMKHNKVQLMVYGSNLNDVKVNSKNKKLKVLSIDEVKNPNYTFINIQIAQNATEGLYELEIKNNSSKKIVTYPIYKRENSVNRFGGFNQNDAIYLVMPDRFVNGDTKNDSIAGYFDSMQKIDGQRRYGGDLKGIIDNLNYIKDLGFTTIWLNPVIENNTFRSYHGYAATDLYNVDPRLGSNLLYKMLVKKAHEKGLKVILDHVANHISDDHPWIKNLPEKSWLNGNIKSHLAANHKKMAFTDLYADSSTIKEVEQGWFVDTMPDLNQKNKLLAKYLIQNTIWWVEYSGLDGIREDTYPYCNQKFMAQWAEEVLEEYPTLNIVGEVWTGTPAFLAGYQAGSKLRKNYNSNLPALTDFAFRDVMVDFVAGKKDLNSVYELFAKDYLYADPTNLVTFLDNHDVGRIAYYANSNFEKIKLAYLILLTTRGIPQILYGSELGMALNEDHGTLRKKFPDGTGNNKRNALLKTERSNNENKYFNFIKNLLWLRNEHPALASGKMIHFPPINNVYLYIKESNNEKFLVIINGNDKQTSINIEKYLANLNSLNSLTDILTSEKVKIKDNYSLKIEKYEFKIFRFD